MSPSEINSNTVTAIAATSPKCIDLIWEGLTKPIRRHETGSNDPRYTGLSPEHIDLDYDGASIRDDDQDSGWNSDFALNDCVVCKGIRKPKHKPTRRPRAHGRPPDSLPSNSNGCDTSAGLSRAFTFGIGKDDRQLGTGPLNFPSLPLILSPDESSDLDFEVHSANVNLYSLPESIPRNAGIRAALPTDEQQMTSIAPLKVKTSNLGAFNSIIGSIPRHHHNNSPCGSTSSSHLADGSVCLEFCRQAKITFFSGA